MAEEAAEDAEQPEEGAEEGTAVDDVVADAMGEEGEGMNLEAVYEIPVEVSVVLGKTTMPISQLLKLGRGAVVELERKVGEAVDVYVNNRLIAKGEVVIVEDRIGITMTEILKSENNR